jgi:putative ABC transport system permease protein
MNSIAIKMLTGDRAKYYGILMGLTFASLLITQQLAIFIGLMTRTYCAITDMGLPDIWVMDPKVQFIDDIKPMQDTVLTRVRGIEGVQWAVPLYKGLISARIDNGQFQTCNVVGLDDATLIGGPPAMLADSTGAVGSLADLRRADAVIVDKVGAETKLAQVPRDALGKPVAGAKPVPLKIGDTLELNDHRAVVVGICQNQRTFQSQPIIYTTYTRALTIAPPQRKLLSFVLVKAQSDLAPQELCRQISAATRLGAYTRDQFIWLTVMYYLRETGIPINFGISVALVFIVGTAIAGQTFHNFTLDNLKHFGALKAMGATSGTLLRIIILQALMVGGIGYGLGVGLASAFGYATRNTVLAFRLPWQLLFISAGAVGIICVLSAMLALRNVVRLEPAIVFKT